MRIYKAAYGAGWRAGMSPRAIIHRQDGTKVLAPIDNPYKKWHQVIQRIAWDNGYHEGCMQSLERWLGRRAA